MVVSQPASQPASPPANPWWPPHSSSATYVPPHAGVDGACVWKNRSAQCVTMTGVLLQRGASTAPHSTAQHSTHPPHVRMGIWISVRPKRLLGTFVPAGGVSTVRTSTPSGRAGVAILSANCTRENTPHKKKSPPQSIVWERALLRERVAGRAQNSTLRGV